MCVGFDTSFGILIVNHVLLIEITVILVFKLLEKLESKWELRLFMIM